MSGVSVQVSIELSDGTEWTISRDGESFTIVADDGASEYYPNLTDLTNLRNALDVFVTGRDKNILLPQADQPVYRGTDTTLFGNG